VFQRKYSNRYRLLRVVNIHPAMTGKHDPTMGGKGIADIDSGRGETNLQEELFDHGTQIYTDRTVHELRRGHE
jgi:hypothetical protein